MNYHIVFYGRIDKANAHSCIITHVTEVIVSFVLAGRLQVFAKVFC